MIWNLGFVSSFKLLNISIIDKITEKNNRCLADHLFQFPMIFKCMKIPQFIHSPNNTGTEHASWENYSRVHI